jgi:Flp pilus assembly protein TadD
MAEAVLREELGDHAGARAAATRALLKARARDLLVQAGDLNRSLSLHAEAEALYDEALKADASDGRNDWRLFFARAAERDRLGRWQEAEADIRRALELEPERPELLNFLGFSWVQRGGDLRGGLELIEKAAARQPDQGYIVDSLGWAHYQLGDYPEAVTHLERAAELSPSDPEIIDHLGDAYWRLAQLQDADYSWRRALQLDPSAALADRLKQKLKGGLADQPRPRAVAGEPEPSRP